MTSQLKMLGIYTQKCFQKSPFYPALLTLRKLFWGVTLRGEWRKRMKILKKTRQITKKNRKKIRQIAPKVKKMTAMIMLLLMSQQQKSHPHRVSDCESIDTKSENNSE